MHRHLENLRKINGHPTSLKMVMLRACFCIPTEDFASFHDAKSDCAGCDDCGRYPILHPSFHHFRVSASVTGTVAGGRERADWIVEQQ